MTVLKEEALFYVFVYSDFLHKLGLEQKYVQQMLVELLMLIALTEINAMVNEDNANAILRREDFPQLIF